jgi:hypothetical protein
MADPINDPELINYANTQIRPLCDHLIQASTLIQSVLSLWSARAYANRFPNDNTIALEDGSPSDGRPPITSADVNGVIAIALQVVALQSANNNANLAQILRVAVNLR